MKRIMRLIQWAKREVQVFIYKQACRRRIDEGIKERLQMGMTRRQAEERSLNEEKSRQATILAELKHILKKLQEASTVQ